MNAGKSYSDKIPLDFSVPQGRCASPILYSNYAGTMKYIVPPNMLLHGYAENHAIKWSFSANNITGESNTLRSLENCAKNIKLWMDSNCLKMNSSKTEISPVLSCKATQKMFLK